MIIRFDALNRFERPLFHLCSPGAKYVDGKITNAIGILSDTSDEELVLNFNAISTLSLRVYSRENEDPEQNVYFKDLFDKVQNRRLIFIENVGFFSITSVTLGYDDGVTIKDVEAESCEVEIQNKNIPYIEDSTYKIEKLMSMLTKTLPMWTVKYIDGRLVDMYRTFEDVDVNQNILGFLMDEIQPAFECIVLFDNIERGIYIYDQNNYVKETSIHLTRHDIVESVEMEENAEDMYTALSVYADGDLTISAINPLGTGTIYNFNYHLSWMSPGLREKVILWQERVKYYSNLDGNTPDADNYPKMGLQYAEKYTEYIDACSELDMLDEQLSIYQRCYDNIAATKTDFIPSYSSALVAAGGEPIPDILTEIGELQSYVKGRIEATNQKISEGERKRDSIMGEVEAIKAKMSAINEEVGLDTFFTWDEYEELSNYISEGIYTDEFVIVGDYMTYKEQYEQLAVLYANAVKMLETVSQPAQEFTVDVENFLFQKEFSHFSEQLETGCIIDVELPNDEIVPLFLASIELNYDDAELSLTFGNRYNKFDPKSMFTDLLGNVKKSANTLERVKDWLQPIRDGELNDLQLQLLQSRNLTAQRALEAEDQVVTIDDTGYTGKKVVQGNIWDSRQVKIVNNSIVFTKDAWETCSTAIGEIVMVDENGDEYTVYGINAEVVMGDMILGGELHIVSEDNSMSFDENGLVITNGINTFTVNPKDSDLLKLSNQKEDIFWVDDKGVLHIRGDGSGLDIESNDSVTGLRTFIQTTGDEIKAGITSDMDSRFNIVNATIDGITEDIRDINGQVATIQTTVNGLSVEVEGFGQKYALKTDLSGFASTSYVDGEVASQISQSLRNIKLSVSGELGGYAYISLSGAGGGSGTIDLSNIREEFANDQTDVTIRGGTLTFNGGGIHFNSASSFTVNSQHLLIREDGTASHSAMRVYGLKRDVSGDAAYGFEGQPRDAIQAYGDIILVPETNLSTGAAEVWTSSIYGGYYPGVGMDRYRTPLIYGSFNWTNRNTEYMAACLGDPTETHETFTRINGDTITSEKAITQSSDRDMKKDITDLPEERTELLDVMIPRMFRYKDEADDAPMKYGYIAQEVEEAIKSVGLTRGDVAALYGEDGTGKMGISYTEFIPLLHLKLRQMEREHKRTISEMERRIQDLEDRLNKLEEMK